MAPKTHLPIYRPSMPRLHGQGCLLLWICELGPGKFVSCSKYVNWAPGYQYHGQHWSDYTYPLWRGIPTPHPPALLTRFSPLRPQSDRSQLGQFRYSGAYGCNQAIPGRIYFRSSPQHVIEFIAFSQPRTRFCWRSFSRLFWSGLPTFSPQRNPIPLPLGALHDARRGMRTRAWPQRNRNSRLYGHPAPALSTDRVSTFPVFAAAAASPSEDSAVIANKVLPSLPPSMQA